MDMIEDPHENRHRVAIGTAPADGGALARKAARMITRYLMADEARGQGT